MINETYHISFSQRKQLLMETEKTWQTQGIVYLGYRVNVSQGQLAIGQHGYALPYRVYSIFRVQGKRVPVSTF